MDQARHAFYKRYWGGRAMEAEAFTVTLNTAELTDEQMAAAVAQLVPSRHGAAGERGRHEAVHRRDAEAAEKA